MTTNQTIHRQMTIEHILSMFPHKAQRLSQEITNAGLHCVGCGAATWETLEGGMYGHGMNDAQIDRLVERLNNLLAEQADSTTVSMTKRAAEKYLEILEGEGKQGWGIRLDERPAGCNGYQYSLDFSEKADANDTIFTSQGVEIHVCSSAADRLIGSEIDYIESLQSSGFTVSNPNARSSCGCGTSHGY